MTDKKYIFKTIDENGESFKALGDRLFDCPELGFKEFKTAEIIKGELDRLGIEYESGIAETGIKAVIGDGKDYNIAIVCDMDALPGKGFTGQIHSCGHSIQTTIALAAAEIIKKTNMLEGSGVSVSLIFTPAEEFIDFEYRDRLIAEGRIKYRSGKQHMIAEGYFDGVDCVLSAHANGSRDKLFDINSTLAGFTAKKAVFTGQASHSGAAPHLGRNTLHGAVLCENAIALLKDQFAPEAGVKINPVITEPGGSVNIIPDRTVLETYVRANDIDTLTYADKRVDGCIEHCAKALELGYEIENTTGYMPLKQSKKLNKAVKNNMLLLCDEEMIEENVVSSASGDVGDLGFLVPTVQFGFAGIDGIFHSDSFKIADRENCYVNTVKVMCGTIADIIDNAEYRDKNENFAEKKEYYLKNWLRA
ncbi:MAG: amidohydrolase [Clostridia bacterium]|nr:amidohydrolase [Clostridia bacterium]